MTLERVFDNISKSYDVFKKYIADRNFSTIKNNYLGWPNYSSGISKLLYTKEYENIISNRQFSFLIKENNGIENQDIFGAIQVYYQFDTNGLKKSRLCYYPKPSLINIEKQDFDTYIDFSFDERLQEIYSILSELVGYEFDISNTTHIRFDFDREVATHSKNHLQIGGLNKVRINSYFILYPFHFIDFIVSNLLPDEHKIITMQENYKFLYTESYKHIKTDNVIFDEKSLLLTLNE